MDGHHTLKKLVDTLFGTLDLKSWTIFENSSGTTTCTLRFCDNKQTSDTNALETANPISYKRKSQGQIKRDRQRMDTFKKPNTRSQFKNADTHSEIENVRQSDRRAESLSDTALQSPEMVSHLNPDASPFQFTSDSQRAYSMGSGSVTDMDIHAETVSGDLVSMPSVLSSEEDTDDDSNHNDNDNPGDNGLITALPPVPKPIPKADETLVAIHCCHSYCAYWDGYQRGQDYKTHKDPDINLYTCALCKDLYLCEHCRRSGAHTGHAAWLQLMQKSH